MILYILSTLILFSTLTHSLQYIPVSDRITFDSIQQFYQSQSNTPNNNDHRFIPNEIDSLSVSFSPIIPSSIYFEIEITGFPSPLEDLEHFIQQYQHNKNNHHNNINSTSTSTEDNMNTIFNGTTYLSNDLNISNENNNNNNHSITNTIKSTNNSTNHEFNPIPTILSSQPTQFLSAKVLQKFLVSFLLDGVQPYHQFEILHSRDYTIPTIQQQQQQLPTTTTTIPIDTEMSQDENYHNHNFQSTLSSSSTSLTIPKPIPSGPQRELRAFNCTILPALAQFKFKFHNYAKYNRKLILKFDIDTSCDQKLAVNDTIQFFPVIHSYNPSLDFTTSDIIKVNVSKQLSESFVIRLYEVNQQELCKRSFKLAFNNTYVRIDSNHIIEIYSHFIDFDFDEDDSEEFKPNYNNTNNIQSTMSILSSQEDSLSYIHHHHQFQQFEQLSQHSTQFNNRPKPEQTCKVSYLSHEATHPLHGIITATLKPMNTTDNNINSIPFELQNQHILMLNFTSDQFDSIPMNSNVIITCPDFVISSPNDVWLNSQYWIMKMYEQPQLQQQQHQQQVELLSPSQLQTSITTNTLRSNVNILDDITGNDMNCDDMLNNSNITTNLVTKLNDEPISIEYYYSVSYICGVDRSDYIAPYTYLIFLAASIAFIFVILAGLTWSCHKFCLKCCRRDFYGHSKYDEYEQINH